MKNNIIQEKFTFPEISRNVNGVEMFDINKFSNYIGNNEKTKPSNGFVSVNVKHLSAPERRQSRRI
jgi:hypothetical protein